MYKTREIEFFFKLQEGRKEKRKEMLDKKKKNKYKCYRETVKH